MGFNKAFEDKKFMIFYVRKLSKFLKSLRIALSYLSCIALRLSWEIVNP